MKISFIFIFIFLFLFSIQFANAYSEDTILQKCIENGNYSTAAMIQCSYDRGDFYKKLSIKQIHNLKNKLTKSDYDRLVQNQILFEQYVKSLDKGEIDILHSTMGSIYPTMASGIYYHIYFDNSIILDMLLTKQKSDYELLNQIPIAEMPQAINKKLALLKNNLTPTEDKIKYNYQKAYIYNIKYDRYRDVKKSQDLWQKYLDNTKNSILPMFKSQPEMQNYILRLIYESRLSALDTINSPFDD